MVIGRDFHNGRRAGRKMSSRYGGLGARSKARGWIGATFCVFMVAAGLIGTRAQALDVLAFGDSLTQGYGLAERDGLVPQLSAWLDAHGAGDVRVINAGVSGDTTAGGKARIDWALTPDVDAVIVELGANDFLRGIDPAQSRANLDAVLASARRAEVEILLVGMRVPANYGAAYQAEFNAIYPELAEAYDTLYMPDFFEGLAQDVPLTSYLQADGLHPTAQGVARIVEVLGPQVLELVARARE